MKKETNTHFKVGELAEARTFEPGFRGAWFRCRIKKINNKGLSYLLEYYDYTDDKPKSTKLYQFPPYCMGKERKRDRELMIRPCYPTICNQNEVPPDNEISEVTVVVDNAWKVGNLVDWWADDCWWSGKIMQLLGDGKAQIELKPPPFGQGGLNNVLLKDIRPSLDWSSEHGWIVPTQDGDTGHPCARLVRPINPVKDSQIAAHDTDRSAGSSVQQSLSSPPSTSSGQTSMEMPMQNQDVNTVLKEVGTLNGADTNSGQCQVSVKDEDVDSNCRLEKLRAGKRMTLNSMQSDSAEAAVLDLEEYLNKVRWLKDILLKGISCSDASRPQWEFVDKQSTL